jgi:hypothetical protein
MFNSVFYLDLGSSANCANREIADGQSVVFDAAIKAQWSDHYVVVLLKPAGLHFFFGPSTGCTMLFETTDQTKRRLSVALDQADDSNDG